MRQDVIVKLNIETENMRKEFERSLGSKGYNGKEILKSREDEIVKSRVYGEIQKRYINQMSKPGGSDRLESFLIYAASQLFSQDALLSPYQLPCPEKVNCAVSLRPGAEHKLGKEVKKMLGGMDKDKYYFLVDVDPEQLSDL